MCPRAQCRVGTPATVSWNALNYDSPPLKAALKFSGIFAAGLALPLFIAPAASALTQSATFNPVLQVDGSSGTTGFTFSGFTGPVSSVTTTINLTKCDDPISTTGECLNTGLSWNEEIRLSLQSPTGTIVQLVAEGNGLGGQTPGDTVSWTFDDTASSLVSGNSLISGTYKPFSSLSAFSGETGNGTWNLLYEDTADGDPMSINGWSLTVNEVSAPPASVPGPLPVLGLAAAFGFSRRMRRRIATQRPKD